MLVALGYNQQLVELKFVTYSTHESLQPEIFDHHYLNYNNLVADHNGLRKNTRQCHVSNRSSIEEKNYEDNRMRTKCVRGIW